MPLILLVTVCVPEVSIWHSFLHIFMTWMMKIIKEILFGVSFKFEHYSEELQLKQKLCNNRFIKY